VSLIGIVAVHGEILEIRSSIRLSRNMARGQPLDLVGSEFRVSADREDGDRATVAWLTFVSHRLRKDCSVTQMKYVPSNWSAIRGD
jgi:hypothetical protein